MELSEKATIGDILKASRAYTLRGILNEVLDHIYPGHIATLLVHKVHIVLPTFHQVLFRHRADCIAGVNDIVFAHRFISAIYREIGTHHHSKDQPLGFILHRIHLRFLV